MYLKVHDRSRAIRNRSVKTIKGSRNLFLERCFIPRAVEDIFAKYLLLRSGGCGVKREKGILDGKNRNFSGTTTCSGNSHPIHRTPCPSGSATTMSGINSRTSSLLWRPSILQALSFWDTEEQISPLPFSGQTNGKQPGSLRDTVPLQFDNVDGSTKATFCEINRTRNRSIVWYMRGDCVSSFGILSAESVVSRHTMLRICCSYIAEFCPNKFKLSDRLTLIAVCLTIYGPDYNITVVEKKNGQIGGIMFSVSIRVTRGKFNFATCAIKVKEMPAYNVEWNTLIVTKVILYIISLSLTLTRSNEREREREKSDS